MNIPSLVDQRVAVLEDDYINRDRLSQLIRMSGGTPVPASPNAPKLIDFEKYMIQQNISLVVCDHRLYEHGNYANYSGAAAIKACYQSGRGGVLVTAWEKDDAESSIREFRRWIPVLIHSTELDQSNLETALIQADREVREKIPIRGRLPYRTIMTITNIVQRGKEKIVKVIMSQWNIKEEVGFPLRIIPYEMQTKVAPGELLIAQVNIEAMRAEDLYFTEFESLNPDVLRKSKTIFSGT
jgi:hypothetical protein